MAAAPAAAHQEDETKPVLGYTQSTQYSQSGHFSQPHNYNPAGYHQPIYNNYHPGYGQQQSLNAYPNSMPSNMQYYPPPSSQSANYYYSYNPQFPYAPPPPKNRFTFARFMVWLMVIIVVGACFLSLLAWLVFGSDMLEFQIDSFVMRSFDVSKSMKLSAQWETNLTVLNPNPKMDIKFDQLVVSLWYKEAGIDAYWGDSIEVTRRGKDSLHAEFRLERDERSDPSVSEMVKDHEKGLMTFEVRIVIEATFKTGTIWNQQQEMKFSCPGLTFDLQNPERIPIWDGLQRECSLFL